MPDNVTITEGSGTQIAADDVGGVKYQRVKISVGEDGVANDISNANPMPVTNTDLVDLSSLSKYLLDVLHRLDGLMSCRGVAADIRATILSGVLTTVSTVTGVTTVSTVTGVTTVSTVTNLAQIGAFAANGHIPAMTNLAAQANINRIT